MVFPKMRILEKSCCGCKVKTGALIISYLTLIQSVVIILNIISQIVPEVGVDKASSDEYKRDLTWLGVVTIVIVAHALWGIYKGKASYMVPFLIFKLVMLFVLTVMLGFAPAIVDQVKLSFKNTVQKEEDVLPYMIITILVAIAVEAYCLLILFSHYQNLRQAAFAQAQISTVIQFSSAASADPETTMPYNAANQFGEDLPKKSPPPPYAV